MYTMQAIKWGRSCFDSAGGGRTRQDSPRGTGEMLCHGVYVPTSGLAKRLKQSVKTVPEWLALYINTFCCSP